MKFTFVSDKVCQDKRQGLKLCVPMVEIHCLLHKSTAGTPTSWLTPPEMTMISLTIRGQENLFQPKCRRFKLPCSVTDVLPAGNWLDKWVCQMVLCTKCCAKI